MDYVSSQNGIVEVSRKTFESSQESTEFQSFAELMGQKPSVRSTFAEKAPVSDGEEKVCVSRQDLHKLSDFVDKVEALSKDLQEGRVSSPSYAYRSLAPYLGEARQTLNSIIGKEPLNKNTR